VSRAAQELARSLEATLVRPIALAADVERLAARAFELNCAAVVVLPPLVATARAQLGRGPVHVVAAVGLPFGAEGARATAAACAQAVTDGADVLDVVASLPLLANGDFPAARDELAAAVAAAAGAAPAGRHIVVRAVIETCYLEPAAWRLAARLVAIASASDRLRLPGEINAQPIIRPAAPWATMIDSSLQSETSVPMIFCLVRLRSTPCTIDASSFANCGSMEAKLVRPA